MKTLFRRDNKVMIRLQQGEFIVANPEILHEKTRWITEKEPTEWGGEVEIIESEECGHPCDDYVDVCQYSGCGYKGRKMVKLLPKVEKRNYSTFSTVNPPESDYKQFEPHFPCVIEEADKFDLPPACVFNLQQIALADDEMVKVPGAAEHYRFIARHILELFTRKPIT